MTGLYLFSMVLGAGFLLLSLLGGDGMDVDMDVDMDLDMDAPGTLDGGGGGAETAFKILSFRGIVYALFGFGATGFLANMLGVASIPTLIAAILGGLASGAMITTIFNWLYRTESGQLPGEASFQGRMGRVTLPIRAHTPGSIAVERGGRIVTLRALPHSTAEGDPEQWDEVMVVELEDGVARVTPRRQDSLME